MDISIKTETNRFKYRACGVIVKNGRVLLDKSSTFNGYVFPGGHIALGESSREAVVREVAEELGVDVSIDKLFCVSEYIYPSSTGVLGQEVAYYYGLSPKNPLPDGDFSYHEVDHGKPITHNYKWLTLDEFENYNVKPEFMKEIILKNAENEYVFSDIR